MWCILSQTPAKAISSLKHDRVELVETTASVYLLESALKSASWFESLKEIDRGKAASAGGTSFWKCSRDENAPEWGCGAV